MVMALIFQSCEETQSPIYDGQQTLVYFDSSSLAISVVEGTTETATFRIGASTTSTSDRTITLSVDEDNTSLSASQYSFSLTNVIPAGSYFSEVSITGIDDSSLSTDGGKLRLNLSETTESGAVLSKGQVDIAIAKVCPIPEGSFQGVYLMEQLGAINPANGVLTFENQLVNVTEDEDNSFRRSFPAVYLEAFALGNPATTIPFTLSCGLVVPDDNISSTLLCVQGLPTIDFGAPSTPSTFDGDDDSVFELTITEYFTEDGGCGVDPFDTTFRFTKQ